jgi:MFS family permease
MTAIAAGVRPRVSIGWAIAPLLALAVFINYVDRGNLATAAPLIKDEMKLSGEAFGLIVSAFFWTYTPGQLLAGWLAEKINPYRTLAIGLAIWSLATALTGVTTGFLALISLRLLLGLGETAVFPCASKIFAGGLAEHQRGAANGLVVSGTALGPAFGTFVGGKMMALMGWRPTFLIFGLTSLLWLAPWWGATRNAPKAGRALEDPEAPSFLEVASKMEVWGAGLGHFAVNYSFYFVITWLPLYLVKARGFSMGEMATLGAEIYLVYAASSLAMGWLADRLIERGMTPGKVRKTWACTSHIIVASGLAACAYGDRSLSLVFLFVTAFGFGFNSSTLFAIGQTLAGPHAGGKWMGFQNGLGNVAGIVGPLITGALVDRTGSFDLAFLVAAGAALTGCFWWTVLIPKVAPVTWSTAKAA